MSYAKVLKIPIFKGKTTAKCELCSRTDGSVPTSTTGINSQKY